jgi:hypothetical protein
MRHPTGLVLEGHIIHIIKTCQAKGGNYFDIGLVLDSLCTQQKTICYLMLTRGMTKTEIEARNIPGGI